MPRQARLDAPGTLHHVSLRNRGRCHFCHLALRRLFTGRHGGWNKAGRLWLRCLLPVLGEMRRLRAAGAALST